jgi:hypothetical protein
VHGRAAWGLIQHEYGHEVDLHNTLVRYARAESTAMRRPLFAAS